MSAAQKRETPLAGGVIAKQNSIEAAIVHDVGDQNKAESTLIAKFALLGHSVHKLADGGFLVTRWSLVRQCPDAAALAAFLTQIGGRL